MQTLTNIGNMEQTNKDENKGHIITKQKITGNYEIIQKILSFVLYPRWEPHV